MGLTQSNNRMSGSFFLTLAALTISTTVTYANYAEGQKLQAVSHWYEVAAEDATDHHLETSGGVKLYVLPGEDGAYSPRAGGKS